MFINQPFCTHRLAISKAGQTVSECTIFKNVCELAGQRFWVSGRSRRPVHSSRVTSFEHDVRFPRVLTVQISPGPSTPSLESFWRNYPKTSQGSCLAPPRAKAALVNMYVYHLWPTSYGFGFWHEPLKRRPWVLPYGRDAIAPTTSEKVNRISEQLIPFCDFSWSRSERPAIPCGRDTERIGCLCALVKDVHGTPAKTPRHIPELINLRTLRLTLGRSRLPQSLCSTSNAYTRKPRRRISSAQVSVPE